MTISNVEIDRLSSIEHGTSKVTGAGGGHLRTRRLLQGIVGASLGRSLSLLAPFLVMPAMLRYLGDAAFGIWMVAVSFTSMAMFADFGIGNSLLTRISAAEGREEYASARADIASAYALLTGLAGAFALLSTIAVVSVSVFRLGRLPADQLGIVHVVLLSFSVGLPASVIQRVMYARQQVMQANLWQMGGSGAGVVLCLGAIHTGLPAWMAVLAYAMPPSLSLLIAGFFYFGRYPKLRPSLGDVHVACMRPLLSLGGRFLALSILTSAALNVDNVLIGSVQGPAAVTAYSVPAKLGSLLGLLITTLFTPLWGANGEALARGDVAWVWRLSWRMAITGAVVVAGVAASLVLSGNLILLLWTHRAFGGQVEVLLGLGLLSTVMAFTAPFNMILNAQGVLRPQILCWATYLVITVGLKWIVLWLGMPVWSVAWIAAAGYALTILPAMFHAATGHLRQLRKAHAL